MEKITENTENLSQFVTKLPSTMRELTATEIQNVSGGKAHGSISGHLKFKFHW